MLLFLSWDLKCGEIPKQSPFWYTTWRMTGNQNLTHKVWMSLSQTQQWKYLVAVGKVSGIFNLDWWWKDRFWIIFVVLWMYHWNCCLRNAEICRCFQICPKKWQSQKWAWLPADLVNSTVSDWTFVTILASMRSSRIVSTSPTVISCQSFTLDHSGKTLALDFFYFCA
jgi:hypothetical protein